MEVILVFPNSHMAYQATLAYEAQGADVWQKFDHDNWTSREVGICLPILREE